jgi:hypothetical protein
LQKSAEIVPSARKKTNVWAATIITGIEVRWQDCAIIVPLDQKEITVSIVASMFFEFKNFELLFQNVFGRAFIELLFRYYLKYEQFI